MLAVYSDTAPERAALDATLGPLVLEFGNNDCGICQAALPVIAAAMAQMAIPHIRVQDGKGRRLGRTYGIKLWPTLLMLQDGKEVARVVRPATALEIMDVLDTVSNTASNRTARQ